MGADGVVCCGDDAPRRNGGRRGWGRSGVAWGFGSGNLLDWYSGKFLTCFIVRSCRLMLDFMLYLSFLFVAQHLSAVL